MPIEVEDSEIDDYDKLVYFTCKNCGSRQHQRVRECGVEEKIDDWTNEDGVYYCSPTCEREDQPTQQTFVDSDQNSSEADN